MDLWAKFYVLVGLTNYRLDLPNIFA